MALVRTYKDVNGLTRRLVLLEEPNFLVNWHKLAPASQAIRWLMEDGRSVIQIPENAWDVLMIEYEDSHEPN